MLEWFKPERKPPKLAAGNTGEAVSLHNRSSKEDIFLSDLLADVLQSSGKSVERQKYWLELEGGFVLQPHILAVEDSTQGTKTTTTIDVNHQILFPQGLFEYQHATENSVRGSIRKGFEDWVGLDFPVLMDATKSKPETCTTLVLTPDSKQSKWHSRRRAVLGPISTVQERPNSESTEEAHPFCPCCLLTNNLQAFETLIRNEGFYGIRLFASNYGEGPAADCRVNGVDYPAGAEALKKYVKTWPNRGFEFRKQYVIVQAFDEELQSKLPK